MNFSKILNTRKFLKPEFWLYETYHIASNHSWSKLLSQSQRLTASFFNKFHDWHVLKPQTWDFFLWIVSFLERKERRHRRILCQSCQLRVLSFWKAMSHLIKFDNWELWALFLDILVWPFQNIYNILMDFLILKFLVMVKKKTIT